MHAQAKKQAKAGALVGVIMGSRNDYAVMRAAVDMLREFGVAHEVRVVSAHRTPEFMMDYAGAAAGRGLRVLIAGAGGAAHLPGMVAARTVLPVLGVPIAATALQGFDALLSIVQMPKGVPGGRWRLALRARRTRGCWRWNSGDHGRRIAAKLVAWRAARRDEVLAQAIEDPGVSESTHPTLLPGATIGIFGGGQLGRLTAMAARSMGYRIHVLDPDPGCPARFVVDQCVEAAWDDAREAARLARGCDVVTLEIEQISLASMNAAASLVPVRPSESVLEVIQDRIVQKDWLLRNGFPVGRYRAVRSLDELRAAVEELGGKCFCKSATGGYDGRGQGKVGFSADAAFHGSDAEMRGAWEALGEGPGVVEQAVALEREISVMVARSPRGEVKVYPAAGTTTRNRSWRGACCPRRCRSGWRRRRARWPRPSPILSAGRNSRGRAICNQRWTATGE